MPPKAFISWAHTAAGWSDDQTRRWAETVAEFAYLLRDHGVDADVDLFHYTERGIDWTRYGPDAIRAADLVLMVSSEPYWERWEGRNDPGEGAGVAREADTLKGLFNVDQVAFQQKTLIVVLPGMSGDTVPYELRRVPCYPLESVTPAGADALLRLFHRRPAFPAGAIGPAPDLLPERQPSAVSRAVRADFAATEAQLAALDAAADAKGMPVDRRRLLLRQRLARLAGEIANAGRGTPSP